MTLKKTLYILLVMAVAGFSALAGALAGGAVVYRSLQKGSGNLLRPVQDIFPSNNTNQTLTSAPPMLRHPSHSRSRK